MIKRYFRRFPYDISGIWHAMRNDFSYQMQVALITPAVFFFCYIYWPLTKTEMLFLGLAYVLILITEIQNSALEEALDHMHPQTHHRIGKSKDMAAGSALLAGFFLIFVMIVIALS